ncbi:MAG: type II secretion system F family protein [Thermaurantiacus sp.]
MSQSVALLLVILLALAALGLGAFALSQMFGRRIDFQGRVSTTPTASAGMPRQQTLRNDLSGSLWARTIAEIERRGLSLEDSKGSVLAERLALAGYAEPWAPRAFVLIRLVLTLALPALVLLLLWLGGVQLSLFNFYVVFALSALAGLYLPNLFVSRRAAQRHTEIVNGFPDALDLMLVCVESGLGLDAGFARVGKEITTVHPRLAELFARVSLELRAGRGRADALNNMARRSGVAELQAFATLVIQSDALGASIGKTLRVYASEMREARRMRAEEKAYRLPVLLSIPLVLFMLPTMIAVVTLPAVINIKNVMFEDRP